MIVKFSTLFFVLTGLQGSKLEYVFDDQADGWLKLYRIPTTWNDAKIRCDTEDAVIATPINEKLRDAISQFVERQNDGRTGRVIAIYTGVHADYADGDYLSIEGVKLSQLPVQQWMTSPNTYRNSESCIVWDQIGYAKLRRVRCDFIFPYVCYKRRANLEPLTPPPTIIPITDHGLGAREPGTNPDIQSYAPTTELQPDKEPQPNRWPSIHFQADIHQPYTTQRTQTNFQSFPNQRPQTNQQLYAIQNPQSNPQSYSNQGSQTNQQNYPAQNPETNAQNYLNQGPQTNQQSNLFQQPQINPQYPSDKMPRTNYQTPPEQGPSSKYSVNITENGSMRHVNYQLKNNNTRSSQNVNEQYTQVVEVTSEMNTDNNNEAGHRQPEITNITEVKPTNLNEDPSAEFSLSATRSSGYSRFIRKAGGRFNLHTQPETFEAASLRCTSEGAVIASPLTNDLKNAITDFIKQNTASSTQFYTGVHANYTNGDFYSNEGVNLSKMPVYLNTGTSTDSQSSDVCITMTAINDIVTSVSCRDRYPYVCFKKSQSVRSCGKSNTDYEYKPQTQSCYKFHNAEKTWSEAYRVCTGEGGHLAVINSKEEAEALKILFSNYPRHILKTTYKNSVYMGLRDWKDGKSWTTVKGVQSSGYIGWAPNEPRNNACSTMSRRGLLNSDPCSLKLSFICEKDSELLYNDDDQDNPNR